MVERPDAAPWYGVIKWIGDLPGHPGEPVAGIEMVIHIYNIYNIIYPIVNKHIPLIL